MPVRHRAPRRLLVLVLAAVATGLQVPSATAAPAAPAGAAATATASARGVSTIHVPPGASLSAALRAARAGDTIVLGAGVHGRQAVADVRLTGPVTVRGESRTGTVVRGIALVNVANVTVTGMTVTGEGPGDGTSAIRVARSSGIRLDQLTVVPTAHSGVDITDGSTEVALTGSSIDGSQVTDTGLGRGVRLYAGSGTDRASWISRVTVTGNDISGAAGDLIQVLGASDLVIAGNHLHDPQTNDAHNDGVQVLLSERVTIEANLFRARGAFGPDQAIMLQPASPAHWISDTRIVNNVVAGWPGTGLVVGGTTRTTVVNNTVVPIDPDDTSWVPTSVLVASPNDGLVVRNNVITRLDLGASAATSDHNCVRFGAGPADVAGDPRFESVDGLRLSAGSPCLGIGMRQVAPLVDRLGRLRGDRPDAGAYQRDVVGGGGAATNGTTRGTTSGYWMVDVGGHVHAFGSAVLHGDAPSQETTVDVAARPGGDGYLLLAPTGTVTARGGSQHLGQPTLADGETATSISVTPTGDGYWVFTSTGRVSAFGDAVHRGDLSGTGLTAPVVDSVATPSGQGYYMVGADGGVFAFGDAAFAGSTGAMTLNLPVRSLVPDPDGAGYWLVAADGGIFAFDAPFLGSMGDVALNRPVSGMVASDGGYLMVAEDGGIFAFGAAPFFGSLGDAPPPQPVVAVAAARS